MKKVPCGVFPHGTRSLSPTGREPGCGYATDPGRQWPEFVEGKGQQGRRPCQVRQAKLWPEVVSGCSSAP